MHLDVVSKSKVDLAGRQLAHARRSGATEPRDASDVVDQWRATHADAMAWVGLRVAERLARAGLDFRVAQRLKRKPQMISKLLRAGTMRLSQMQDVGGCRVLLQGLDDVEEARSRLVMRAGRYEVAGEANYCEAGRPVTKYRAVHLVLLRGGRAVEVQLRTRRQHAWAEAVERVAERTGHALKDGQGPQLFLDFFGAASDAYWLLDRGERVPTAMRRELRLARKLIIQLLPSVPNTRATAKLNLEALTTRTNNWLIIYNWREARFVNWIDCGTDAAAAAQRYGKFEREYPYEEGYEVVLIGANSNQTISETHAHYFGGGPNDIDPHGCLHEIL
jgi:hypothetical protein